MRSALESSSEHLRLLGVLTARWATLDIILMSLVGKLLGDMTSALSIYFSSGSQKMRFDLINALLNSSKKIDESKKGEVRRLIKKLSRLSERRNQIVHCYATETVTPNLHGIINSAINRNPDDATYHAIRHQPAHGKLFEEIPLTIKSLQEHVDALSDNANALIDLVFNANDDSDDVPES